MNDIVWDKLTEPKRKKLTGQMDKLAVRFAKINYTKPARTTVNTKVKFYICRMIQKKVRKSGNAGLDNEYWEKNGWLKKGRPWKRNNLRKN